MKVHVEAVLTAERLGIPRDQVASEGVETHGKDSWSVTTDEESVAGEPEVSVLDEETPGEVATPRGSHPSRTTSVVMKAVPKFMRVPFRNALKLALCDVTQGRNEVDQEHGWKLFFMFPWNFGGGNISPALWLPVRMCDEEAARARRSTAVSRHHRKPDHEG